MVIIVIYHYSNYCAPSSASVIRSTHSERTSLAMLAASEPLLGEVERNVSNKLRKFFPSSSVMCEVSRHPHPHNKSASGINYGMATASTHIAGAPIAKPPSKRKPRKPKSDVIKKDPSGAVTRELIEKFISLLNTVIVQMY